MEENTSLYKDAINKILDKFTSPLLFSFLVAWSTWNYKVIMTILSDEPVYAKFAEIELILDVLPETSKYLIVCNDCTPLINNSYLIPFTIAFLYLFIYPILSMPVRIWDLFVRMTNKAIDLVGFRRAPKSQKDWDDLFRDKVVLTQEIYTLKNKHNTDIAAKDDYILKQQGRMDAKQNELDECLKNNITPVNTTDAADDDISALEAATRQIADDYAELINNIEYLEHRDKTGGDGKNPFMKKLLLFRMLKWFIGKNHTSKETYTTFTHVAAQFRHIYDKDKLILTVEFADKRGLLGIVDQIDPIDKGYYITPDGMDKAHRATGI